MAPASLCQLCKQNPATVEITQHVKGEKYEWMVCDACAQEKGKSSLKFTQHTGELPEFFENVLGTILGDDESDTGAKMECPECQLTLEEFERIGLLGCSSCYLTFREELGILLKKIHGSNKHIGSSPRPARVIANIPDIEALKKELREAIEHENYERAADYRDMIRNLEREMHRDESGVQEVEKA